MTEDDKKRRLRSLRPWRESRKSSSSEVYSRSDKQGSLVRQNVVMYIVGSQTHYDQISRPFPSRFECPDRRLHATEHPLPFCFLAHVLQAHPTYLKQCPSPRHSLASRLVLVDLSLSDYFSEKLRASSRSVQRTNLAWLLVPSMLVHGYSEGTW